MNIDGVSKTRIILAVKDARRREAYLSALGTSVGCTVLETLVRIPDLLRERPFSGILIDINLNVKTDHMEKVKISDSLAAMPSATVNLNAGNGRIRLLMLNCRHGSARTPEEFVKLCATFQPEILYPSGGDGVYLNAVLSPSPEFGPDAECTFAMHLSGSGCFLFTANKTGFRQHDTVWIDFVGLGERKPVVGTVRWKCEWGVSHSAPGVYVSFESILESQHEEIMSLLRAHA